MLTVNLKAKHLYYVCNDLRNFAASEYFSLLGRVKAACVDLADDDVAPVEVSVHDLVKIFNVVAYKPEGQANRINTDMMALLAADMEAGITAQDAEWIEASTQIEAIRNSNWNIADNAIAAGKAFIQG